MIPSPLTHCGSESRSNVSVEDSSRDTPRERLPPKHSWSYLLFPILEFRSSEASGIDKNRDIYAKVLEIIFDPRPETSSLPLDNAPTATFNDTVAAESRALMILLALADRIEECIPSETVVSNPTNREFLKVFLSNRDDERRVMSIGWKGGEMRKRKPCLHVKTAVGGVIIGAMVMFIVLAFT
ncbi:MAG: hypothetical protein NXY57DRAFT_53262 [Lentinula lateritia]|nr:MAG: hypothetical protein NXY57DRAFT_53262 [Lentinula lateritia]